MLVKLLLHAEQDYHPQYSMQPHPLYMWFLPRVGKYMQQATAGYFLFDRAVRIPQNHSYVSIRYWCVDAFDPIKCNKLLSVTTGRSVCHALFNIWQHIKLPDVMQPSFFILVNTVLTMVSIY